ncbi:KIR protein [Plasmodium coatneyi]|uniref:KIR protein n=1 Tax=Plasmodium coatneyi TaxID=208452 RepID=A0A1B1DY91_9APIC|nr:KIR protein [Plasmodium coatneyi]ANQ07555.1 KIR protein [Plasmodium coatneyi]
MAPDASPGTAILTEEELGTLPSREKYKELNDKSENGGDTRCWSELKDKLKRYIKNNDSVVKKIIKAFCYIYGMQDSTREKEGWCDYFYYWLGDILPKGLADSMFGSAMNILYNKMEREDKGQKCKVLYTSNSREVFEALKTVFDYKKDENTIRTQLGNGEKKKCAQQYYSHLRGIEGAYKILNDKCKEGTMREWYNAFTKKYEGYKSEKVLQLNCILTDQRKAITRTADSAVEGTGTASIAVPSALVATVGLPTIAVFLLYKYGLLPSWISNYFGGGRNNNSSVSNIRRRKRTIESDFETLTNHSTDVSTVYSTIADLTDGSTVYGGTQPPTRGRRTNNGRREGNRNNISYQRI